MRLGKLYLSLITGVAILLISSSAAADFAKKQNKSSENYESQTLAADPDPSPSTESPHGISEHSNASEGDQRSSAKFKENEKNKSSSPNNPKQ